MDRLISFVDASGKKHNRIAADAGMKPGKFSKIINRKQEPTIHEYLAIARALNIDPARLFTEGEVVLRLDALRTVHTAAEHVYEMLSSWLPEAPELVPLAFPKPAPRRDVAPVRAAANPNAELVVESEPRRQRIPRQAWSRGARIIARVVGDSMDGGNDPIADGELAYLKPTRSPRKANGHVTLVRRDEGLFLKLFEMSGQTIRLVSTNNYDAIELDVAGENMQVYGYVVDHARDLSS